MQTTKCVICGDVVLSSFLSKHEFFVHGEGSKSSDAKVKQQWKNNLYPIAGPKSVLPHSILDSVDKYLDERDSHPPEQEIPSDQCHAVAHYELANKSHQETDLKIPVNFATERQKEDPKDERPPLEQRKKIVQKPSKTARKKKKELATEHFKKAEKLLYSSFGERNLTALQTLKDELYNMQKSSNAAEIKDIHQDMQEEEPEGAFICAYPIFREFYRL